MADLVQFLWEPLLEGSAKTLAGALGAYGVTKIVQKLRRYNTFVGPMDFWQRGLRGGLVEEGDDIIFDGLISPYTQLFPGNPMRNGARWSTLYEFEGKIDKDQYQAMDFYAGADVALRLKSLNGETVVGLYQRYGYVGDGLVGVAPTKQLLKAVPDFFQPDFFCVHARVYAKISRCPSAHFAAAQQIAAKAGVVLDKTEYKSLYYLNIAKIVPARRESERTCTLIGSPWAVSASKRDQYLVQYGYISEPAERQRCIDKIFSSKGWKEARVFFDDISNPSEELSFGKTFLR
jgi:hypothetical protein